MDIADAPKQSVKQKLPKLAELRQVPDCVKLLNTAGRISFMGEQGLKVMELDDLSQVVGKSWWDFWPADQRDAIKSRFDAAMAGDVQQFRAKRRMAKGTLKDWSVTLSPIPGETGDVTSVLVLSRDVTTVP